MKLLSIVWAIALMVASTGLGRAQQSGPAFTKPDMADSTPAVQDPATETQIREYLRVSGEMDEFRKSWISAVNKNRSIGAPYWPESFWQAVKDEMQKTDLVPMYTSLFQRGVSRELLQEVIDAYRERGREHFKGSPECFKLGSAIEPLQREFEKLKLAETQTVVAKVYAEYKPQIKAARARYIAQHPEWKDK
jgi:hypothetical protein